MRRRAFSRESAYASGMPRSAEAAERERLRRQRVRQLDAVLREAVADLGFTSKGDRYLLPLAPGLHGWLALEVSRERMALSVAPNVGVRHDELEAFVWRLRGRNPQPTPTLVRMLSYLMPENTANVAWEFHADDDADWADQASNLATHVKRYAFPWMDRYSTLEDVLAGIDEGLSLFEPELRPAALLLLGRRDDALREIDERLAAIKDRADPAAENFRAFANALRAES